MLLPGAVSEWQRRRAKKALEVHVALVRHLRNVIAGALEGLLVADLAWQRSSVSATSGVSARGLRDGDALDAEVQEATAAHLAEAQALLGLESPYLTQVSMRS